MTAAHYTDPSATSCLRGLLLRRIVGSAVVVWGGQHLLPHMLPSTTQTPAQICGQFNKQVPLYTSSIITPHLASRLTDFNKVYYYIYLAPACNLQDRNVDLVFYLRSNPLRGQTSATHSIRALKKALPTFPYACKLRFSRLPSLREKKD
jgi:hypothetical protein